MTVDLGFSGTADGSDYTLSGTQIVIPAGETTGTVTITAVDDALNEGDETVVVDITNVTNATATGQVTTTITDDDPAPTVTLSIDFDPIAEAAGVATVTATLDAPSGLEVTVDLGFSGTASGADYTLSGTQIVILAGETTGTVTITAVDDALNEADETVVVDTTNVTNATGTGQVTTTITDDDPAPTVTLSIDFDPIAEAAGVATVTATLDAPSGLEVTVDLGFSGTASGADYTLSGTQIVILAGETTGTVTITAVDDALNEADETVVVDTTNVTNATGTGQVTTTITDDDPAPTVTLSIAPDPIAEVAGVATVTATLDAPSGLEVTVDLGFSGTADGADYTLSGTQIVIPAGETTGTVTITAVDDALNEADETVVVDITNVTNATGTGQVTTTITDDDPAPTVTLSIDNDPIAEAAGVATVTATLDAPSGLEVTVDLGFSGTASGADYTESGTQIVIPAGETTGTVTITAVDDALDEADETVVVDITNVTNATGTGQVTTTITDDDPVPTVTLSIDFDPIAEVAGVAMVTATLDAPSGLEVTVDLGFSGTADGSDYTLSGTQIVIPAGETTGTVTITAVDDALNEGDETVVVDITNVTNATGTGQVTTTITDDDPAPTVTLSIASDPIAEAAGVATVTAMLDAPSSLEVTVDLGFSGTASGADYTLSGTQIVIPAGETSGTVTITAVDDALDETDETVVVDITNVTNATGTGQVTTTITDDDPAPTVTLSIDNDPIAEAAGVATVMATLDAPSGLEVTVDLGFSGTASGADYTLSGTEIVIPAGETTGTVTMTAVDDALDEADETVVVDITNVTNATGTGQVTTTITDDDAPNITVTPDTGISVTEAGDQAILSFQLEIQPTDDVTIGLVYDTDALQIVPDSLLFSPQDFGTPQTVTVSAIDDLLAEGLHFSGIHLAVVSNDPLYHESAIDEIMAMIADNDMGDQFNRPDGTGLGPDWSLVEGSFDLSNRQAMGSNPNQPSLALNLQTDAVETDGVRATAWLDLTNGPGHSGLVLRASADGQNLYLGALAFDGSFTIAHLWKRVDGEWIPLAIQAVADQPRQGVLEFTITGSVLELRLDGEIIARAEDGEITDAGFVGIRGTGGMLFDDLVAEPVALPAAPVPYDESFDVDNGPLPDEWIVRAGDFDVSENAARTAIGGTAILNTEETLDNAIVEADVDLSGEDDAHVGLVARYGGPLDQNMYLGALVRQGEHLFADIWVQQDGEWTQLVRQRLAPSASAGRLQFHVHGDHLQLALDGAPIARTTDSSLSGAGYVGIRGCAGQTIDNFHVEVSSQAPTNEVGGLVVVTGGCTETSPGQITVHVDKTIAVNSNETATADVVVSAQVSLAEGVAAVGFVTRYNGPGDDNWYWGTLVRDDSMELSLQIYRSVNGTVELIGIESISAAEGTLTFSTIGETLRLSLGSHELSITDSAISGAGHAGLRGFAETTYGSITVT